MITCAAIKNKTSTDRCPYKAAKGLKFCGRHAKVKDPKLWSDLVHADDKIVLIQKVWRGYYIRHRLKLAGPGVLKRSVCHNEEELVTMDSKTEVSPLDYFAFEEAGKVYWFDIRSISEQLRRMNTPNNPYTREPLSMETRTRLRKLATLRNRLKLPTQHEQARNTDPIEMILSRWRQVSQISEECGFFGINPELFASLNRTQLFMFVNMMRQDTLALANEHKSNPTILKYAAWFKRLINEYSTGVEYVRFSFLVSTVLSIILHECRDPYTMCFVIMSALYRL